MKQLFLGRDGEKDIFLPAKALLRHAVCLGSSGSGKTVACKVIVEEFLSKGLPVIAVDPQGDIASLAMPAAFEDIKEKGITREHHQAFIDKAEVVVWTPASKVGVPLSVNPLASTSSSEEMSEEEFLRERSFASEALTELIGFDVKSNDGRTAIALFSILLSYAAEQNLTMSGISELLRLLTAMPKSLADIVSSIAEAKMIEKVIRALRITSMGPQGLMLAGGVPLDIDTLLGLNDPELKKSGKTRLSVVYLNSLGSERERQFFLGQLAQSLYRWMLDNPSTEPQALFYVDEVAPYIPPVKKPACKDALKLLLRQARKYGVCCLLATQSPGDLDYTALSQIGTWNLGRLMTRQEQKKVESVLESIVPEQAEEITQSLPSLRPGNFCLISPDSFSEPIDLQVRWLLTEHKTLDEDGIGIATDLDVRERIEDAFLTKQPKISLSNHQRTGPMRGRAEVAVLAVDEEGLGGVTACEIVVQRGGSGKISALGSASRISKESVKIAWETAKDLQTELELPSQFSRNYDLTILDTRGAIKGDGPSAGLAYFTGIVAALNEQSPRADVAMTGEITILGKIQAVGGIEEKISAAYNAGYATVVVPKENQGDIVLLPSILKENIEIVQVSVISEALKVIFASPLRKSLEPPKQKYSKEHVALVESEEEGNFRDRSGSKKIEQDEYSSLSENELLILELLRKEPATFEYEQIEDYLALSRKQVSSSLKTLIDGKMAKKAKVGRKAVFYHSDHALLPEYDLLEPVEAVRLAFFESEAKKRAESDLARSFMMFEKEEVKSMDLFYRPLYKMQFSATIQEGWLFTKLVEKQDNLYFDAVSGALLSHISRKGFVFEADVPSNPIDVVDLDNLSCLESCFPGELPLRTRDMKNLIDSEEIIASARRKFALDVLDISLVFLPIWKVIIQDLESPSQRTLLLDGWEGYPLELPRRPRKKRSSRR